MSNQKSQPEKHWFPAKKRGWGWGVPSAWQGWVTLVVYVSSVLLGATIFSPRVEGASLLLWIVVLSGMLFAVCWIKGEPPSWR